MRCLATLALLLAVAGCAATPPAGWESGGGELFMPRARWVNGATVVDIDDQGRVYVDGRHWVSIDTAGRMSGADPEPVALLREDGMVYGPADRPLG